MTSDRNFDEWQQTALWVGGFAILLWVLEFIDVLLATDLNQYGVAPRSSDGLLGIVFAPLLHGGWGHLWSNTVPLLVLGFLTLITGVARGLLATGIIWLVAGVGVWLVASPQTVHIGASGLVFGWITYLGVRGFLTGRNVEVIVGILVLVFYGSVLLGALPGQAGVSWEGHLFGAVGGVVAALLLRGRAGRRPAPGPSYPRDP